MDASNTNITLSALNEAMGAIYYASQPLVTSDKNAQVNALCDIHLNTAIKNYCPSLFNDKIVSLISSEAYDRGHSSGGQEIVCQAMSVAEFAKNILEASK